MFDCLTPRPRRTKLQMTEEERQQIMTGTIPRPDEDPEASLVMLPSGAHRRWDQIRVQRMSDDSYDVVFVYRGRDVLVVNTGTPLLGGDTITLNGIRGVTKVEITP